MISTIDDIHLVLSTGEYRALVIGSNGAIGNAFANAFAADSSCINVCRISRSLNTGFDLLDEKSIHKQAEISRTSGPYQIIVDATGVLTIDGIGPEKSLASINHETMTKNFQINAIGPALILRYFAGLLATGPSIYAKLSARVGSISDNQKGGWYGYRAAKAALNMLLQTASIELQRKNPELRVVALQPGTVRSKLSNSFASSVPHFLEPEESVAGMLNVMRNLSQKKGAHYVDYKGQPIDW
jgi:NAD(P)-dependent dehydrogenase (short-subunit alcohol dehydrogenase family)